jgi:hypothetical protein
MLVVLSREPFSLARRPVVRLDIVAASSAEQKERWQQALGEHEKSLDGRLDALISQFTLSAEAIDAASAAALSAIDADGPGHRGEPFDGEDRIQQRNGCQNGDSAVCNL